MPPPPERNEPQKTLERVISKAGLGSRTEARSWIHAGRVAVNGRVIENPDHWVTFSQDRVTFDGQPLTRQKRLYLLLYKPTGYLTTYKDPEGRPTVYDLLAGIEQFISPVGRLDQDSSGLLLLTNDTQLAERLTNPEFHVAKTYQVKCRPQVSDEAIAMLAQGVTLDDGPTRPAQVRRLMENETHSFLEIIITEGRNRQVRRMLEAVGSRVEKLVRTRIGSLSIGDLPVGRYRELSLDELRMLKQESSDGKDSQQDPRAHGGNGSVVRAQPGRDGSGGGRTGKRRSPA
ncbi:MAG: pseudouridine synthase [Acidobacteria bacterium]|nr:pseudouridine synthase [Acidobacteriota bacterium]